MITRLVRTIDVSTDATDSGPYVVELPTNVNTFALLPGKNDGVMLAANVPLAKRAAVFQAASFKASPVAQGICCGLVSDVNAGPIEFEPAGLPGQSGAPLGSVPTP